MSLPIKISWNNGFLLGGVIIIWIFPIYSLIDSLMENDIMNGFFGLIVGITASVILFILIKIVDKFIPSVS